MKMPARHRQLTTACCPACLPCPALPCPQAEEFARVQEPLFRQISRCLTSSHFQVRAWGAKGAEGEAVGAALLTAVDPVLCPLALAPLLPACDTICLLTVCLLPVYVIAPLPRPAIRRWLSAACSCGITSTLCSWWRSTGRRCCRWSSGRWSTMQSTTGTPRCTGVWLPGQAGFGAAPVETAASRLLQKAAAVGCGVCGAGRQELAVGSPRCKRSPTHPLLSARPTQPPAAACACPLCLRAA